MMRMFKHALPSVAAAACSAAWVFAGCAGQTATLSDRQVEPRPTGMGTGRRDEAQAAADPSPTPKTLYAMARVLAAQGRDAECEATLQRIIQEHRQFRPAYCELAELLIRNRRVSQAVQTLRAGLQVEPNDSILLNNLGICRLLQAEYPLASALFTQAASAMPGNARYRANLALALGMMGRYEEAQALYEQVLPADEAAWNLDRIREARAQARAPNNADVAQQ
jgi:Flp pilus assembly protein TadD